MRKLFRSGRTSRAAPIRLSGKARLRSIVAGAMRGGWPVAFALGATGAQAQSVDVFGPSPPASPTATATLAPAAKNPQIIPVFKDPVGKSPVDWTPRPGPPIKSGDAPRAPIPRVQAKGNSSAETPRPRIAYAPLAAPVVHASPVARLAAALPAEAAAPVARPALAASVATPPAALRPPPAAPRPAATPVAAGPRPLAHDMLYPLGVGLGLALELGLLWLFLRWRARRAKRAQADAAPSRMARPAPRKAAPPEPAVDEEHAATIARLFDQAHEAQDDPAQDDPAPDEESPRASTFIAAYADAPAAPEPPIARGPVIEIARRPAPAHSPDPPTPEPQAAEPERTPPARGVFKPSPLFNRIPPAEPARPVPVAPPDPLTIGFEALRLSTSASRIELRFRVTLRNDGAMPLGPIRVDSCMTTPEGDLPDTALAHSLAALMPGEEAAIAEEWRVPLAKLPALRLGAMRLLVGAARIFATVEGAAAHPFQDRSFMIGLPEEGGRLVPIPLDGRAHLYDNLLVQSIASERG